MGLGSRLSGWKGRTFEFFFPCQGEPKAKGTAPKQPTPARMRHLKLGKNPAVGTSGSQKSERRVQQPNGSSAHQETPTARAGDTHKDRWEYEQVPEQESRAHRVPVALCTETPAESQETRQVPELQQAGDSRPIAVRNLR